MTALNARGDDQPLPSIAVRRREFVAREIGDAAFRAFDERGYENVTIADIAAAAGISRRTFFRYFSSKDHVLRVQQVRLYARVIRALERRPPDEPAVLALCRAFLDTAEVAPDEREGMRLRNRVLHQSRSQAGLTAIPPEITSEVVELVAARMGLDPVANLRPHLVVATVWAAAGAASAHWAATAEDDPLTTTLQNAFDDLMMGLGALDRHAG